MLKKTGSLLVLFIYLIISCIAGEITIKTSVNRKIVPINQTLQLTLSVDSSQNIPNINLPSLKDFHIVGQSSSTQVQFINGKTSSTKSYIYTLKPKKEGSTSIPAFKFSHKNKTYITNPITIQVTKYVTPNVNKKTTTRKSIFNSIFEDDFFNKGFSDPFLSRRNSIPEQKVILEYYPLKTSLYIGEKTKLKFNLYFNKGFQRGPVITPVELKGLILEGNLDKLNEIKPIKTSLNGKDYNLITLTQLIYATSDGIKEIPSIKAQYIDNPFYGVKTVSSKPSKIRIESLPEPQPDNFSGAIGSFKLKVASPPKSSYKVGEDIPLKITLSGIGNADMVSKINLSTLGSNVDIYLNSIETNSATGLKANKVFNYLLNIKSEKFPTGSINFCYFNPNLKKYKKIKYDLPKITIDKQKSPNLNKKNQLNNKFDLKKGSIQIQLNTQTFYSTLQYLFKLLLAILALILLVILINLFLKRYSSTLQKAKRRLSKLSNNKNLNEEKFIEEIYSILSIVIEKKFHINIQSTTKDKIKTKINNQDTLNFIFDISDKYEAVKYGKIGLNIEDKKLIIVTIKRLFHLN